VSRRRRDYKDSSFTIHSDPTLLKTKGPRTITVATDGSLITDTKGLRVITGAAVTRDGRWQAWRRVLPTRPDAHDAGSTLAELLAPLLAIRALSSTRPITVITDNAAVEVWLHRLVGPEGVTPRHLTGPAFKFPTVPAQRSLVVLRRPRTDPLIGVAHDLSALMHRADRSHRTSLAVRLNYIVQTSLDLSATTTTGV
jgi:hypothetical protein